MKRTDTRGIKRSKQTRFDGSVSQKYLSLSLKRQKQEAGLSAEIQVPTSLKTAFYDFKTAFISTLIFKDYNIRQNKPTCLNRVIFLLYF
jgi:hypothetical protein